MEWERNIIKKGRGIKCPYCKKLNPAGARTCYNCGRPL